MEELSAAALRLAAPLLLAALGELVVQRAGVVNIGIEGMMLTGAFVAFAIGCATDSAWLGCGGALLATAGVGVIFAIFAVARRADMIVTGMAINLLALGATGLASRALYAGAVPTGPTLSPWRIPALGELPFLGPVLFAQSPFFLAAIAVSLVLAWGFARTRIGLAHRAVGDSARAADAEGVDVDRVRFRAVVIGAALAGLGGAALTLSQTNTFTEGMTAGRGFLALAIVVFGRWRPLGVMAGGIFFGAAIALQFRLQARGYAVPYPVFLMFPYAITLLALALVSRPDIAPRDLGRPYRPARTL